MSEYTIAENQWKGVPLLVTGIVGVEGSVLDAFCCTASGQPPQGERVVCVCVRRCCVYVRMGHFESHPDTQARFCERLTSASAELDFAYTGRLGALS